MKIQLEGAEIVWPQAAKDYYEFTLVTEPDSNGIILARKHGLGERATCSISSKLVPRRLSEKEIKCLVKSVGKRVTFETGKKSYYQLYRGLSSVGILFRNKSKTHALVIFSKLEL